MGTKERLGEGTPTADLILTKFRYALPAGAYTVEIGAVHRSSDRPEELLAPAGPAIRLQLQAP